MDDDINSDIAGNRRFAEFMLGTLTKLTEMLIEQSAASGRWLNSSLLLINGSAALAIATIAIPPIYKLSAVGLFVVGVILSLIQAFVGLKFGTRLAQKYGEMQGYWVSVIDHGLRVQDIENEQLGLSQTVAKWARLPTAIGFTSLLAFCLGIAVAAYGAIRSA